MTSKPVDGKDPSISSFRGLALHRTSVAGQEGIFQLLTGDNEHYTKSLFSNDFETCMGNYRVVALGPKISGSGLYAWAVVSTPFKTSLFVIARNAQVCIGYTISNIQYITLYFLIYPSHVNGILFFVFTSQPRIFKKNMHDLFLTQLNHSDLIS